MTGILSLSIDASTLSMLKNADVKMLLYAVLLVIAGWLLDALKFMTLARAADEKLSFKSTLAVV